MKSYSPCLESKTQLIFKAFYFVFYAGYISFLLYIPVYFKYLGLSAISVGLLNGIRPLMQAVGAPLWGALGDKFRIRKAIFIVAFFVMTVKTMMFFAFRPENTKCVVTYQNSSKNIIRNETYFVKHHIIKRWSPNENLNWEQTNINTNRNVELLKNKGTDSFGNLKTLNAVNKSFERDMTNEENFPQQTRNKRESVGSDPFMEEERTLVKYYPDHSVKYKIIYDDKETNYIFFGILILVICGDAFDAAVFTLADTSCLDTLGSENYGYYRLWGSAGWGVMSPIIGFVITQLTWDYCGISAGSYYIIFYFYLGFMILGVLFGSQFEFSSRHKEQVNKTVKSALLNFHYGIFLFVTFYAGVCYGFLLYFVNWFIDSLGGNAIIMGTATAFKSAVDVLIFFLSERIINTCGHLNTVTVSLMAYIGAFVSYSYITEPWYSVPIEVLHSGAYAMVWSASVSYLNKAAPAGSSATVQGILQGVYWGLGTGGGTIVGGFVVYEFGLRSTFRGFACVTGVVLAVFLATQLVSRYSDFGGPPKDGKEEISDEDESSDHDDELFLSPKRSNKKPLSDEEDDNTTMAGDTWKTYWQAEPAEKLEDLENMHYKE